MTDTEEKMRQLEQKLKQDAERSADIGKAADRLENEVKPPRAPIDHANDGGVV